MINTDEARKVHGAIQKRFKAYADKIIFPVTQHKRHTEGRVEGETWTDSDGKKWEMKNGFPQSITKLDGAKTPWWCPECGLPLNNRLHMKMFRKKGKCHRCVVEEETKMRMDGTYKDYEDKNLLLNKMAYFRDRVIELAYYLENLHSQEFQIYNEDLGTLVMVEKWEVPLDKLRKDVGDELVNCNRLLTEMEDKYRERWGHLPGEEPDNGGSEATK